MNKCRLLMLGAMYENGGNTTHRFLDGHPQLHVYPFESQVGSKYVNDGLSSLFPLKYRWPSFLLEATPYQDYKAIIDEEGKVRSRTPKVSKFRHWPFEMNDDERCEIYQEIVAKQGRSRGGNVMAFFEATFKAWKNVVRTGKEQFYVGYSPILVVDAMKMLEDLPDAHFLHVVRNPWSAYADTKKRPVPLSLENYLLCWTLNQHYALLAQQKYPDRMHILRAEDVMADSYNTIGGMLEKMGLEKADSLKQPTFNAEPLTEVFPWGTIRIPTPEANKATAMELSKEEQAEVGARAWQYMDVFKYGEFLK